MSTVKISELTALSSADAADELVIVDDSAGVTKKITHANLANFGTRTVTAGAIDFSGLANAAGMTSEVLDDYEEGTWTPVLTDGTNNATMNTSNTFGKYQKIGNNVFIQADVRLSSLGAVSGDTSISGLPFSASAAHQGGTFAVGFGGDLAITAGYSVTMRINTGDNTVRPEVWDSTTGTTQMQHSEWSAIGRLIFSGSYFV